MEEDKASVNSVDFDTPDTAAETHLSNARFKDLDRQVVRSQNMSQIVNESVESGDKFFTREAIENMIKLIETQLENDETQLQQFQALNRSINPNIKNISS